MILPETKDQVWFWASRDGTGDSNSLWIFVPSTSLEIFASHLGSVESLRKASNTPGNSSSYRNLHCSICARVKPNLQVNPVIPTSSPNLWLQPLPDMLSQSNSEPTLSCPFWTLNIPSSTPPAPSWCFLRICTSTTGRIVFCYSEGVTKFRFIYGKLKKSNAAKKKKLPSNKKRRKSNSPKIIFFSIFSIESMFKKITTTFSLPSTSAKYSNHPRWGKRKHPPPLSIMR